MILFGEFNVFSPAEVLAILHKLRATLHPAGRLILEIQTYEAGERAGHCDPSEQRFPSGLFSDQPYHCRTESRWLPGEEVAVQTFSVTELAGGRKQVYRSTTQAWSDGDLADLLSNSGFSEAAPRDQWPCNTDALRLWVARVN
ncbi:MAG TPA: hypothetical protein DD670_03965 [Planctomycetaceae bacterium]|nr:hypothetical protein [Planctomycetaceae bacterium]